MPLHPRRRVAEQVSVPARCRDSGCRVEWEHKGAPNMRKFICAAVVVVVGLGVALGEEFNATITKIEDGKVTFTRKKKGEEPKTQTLPMAASAKPNKGKFDADTKKIEVGDTITKEAFSEMVSKAAEGKAKGLNARITTDDDGKNITAIVVTKKGKKGGGG